MAPSGRLAEVTDNELARYAGLIYERTGIRISPQKKTLLSNRLRRRLRETGSAGFGDYYKYLRRLPPADPEWDAFLQEITTHETFLFRDEGQWQWFRKEYLPAARPRPARAAASGPCAFGRRLAARRRSLHRRLLHCRLPAQPRAVADPHLGTDIGTGAVQQAKTAWFGERAMRLVPESCKRRYFRKAATANVWQACPVLTRMVTFRKHNLLDRLRDGPFDLVFLRTC